MWSRGKDIRKRATWGGDPRRGEDKKGLAPFCQGQLGGSALSLSQGRLNGWGLSCEEASRGCLAWRRSTVPNKLHGHLFFPILPPPFLPQPLNRTSWTCQNTLNAFRNGPSILLRVCRPSARCFCSELVDWSSRVRFGPSCACFSACLCFLASR